MKKLFFIAIAVTIALYFAVHEQNSNTVVIYSALEQYRNDDLEKHLQAEFPDYHVQIMYMPTAKIAAKIKSEKEHTDADILLGVETGYLEMIKDSLAEVSSYSTLDYLDGLNPEHGKYLIWESYGGGFAVNTTILEKYGLEEPSSYEDLLKPEYKDLIVIQDPKVSSTGYNFYLNLRNEYGLEKTLEYYDKLNNNVKQYAESGSGPVKMLIQGECAIGTALTYQVVTEMNNGHPLKMIYPEEGSPYSLDGVTIVKGKETEKVKEIFTYIVNDYLVYDKQMYNPGKILKDQESKLENYPQDIKYADMSGIDDLELKEEMLAKWKY
ncbi:MAG: extracellular solute-binding protein [Erysipelotrichaceae bacterium]|nr:extracellular solute-binding protein [Erysipelotrichaceae bacterium]